MKNAVLTNANKNLQKPSFSNAAPKFLLLVKFYTNRLLGFFQLVVFVACNFACLAAFIVMASFVMFDGFNDLGNVDFFKIPQHYLTRIFYTGTVLAVSIVTITGLRFRKNKTASKISSVGTARQKTHETKSKYSIADLKATKKADNVTFIVQERNSEAFATSQILPASATSSVASSISSQSLSLVNEEITAKRCIHGTDKAETGKNPASKQKRKKYIAASVVGSQYKNKQKRLKLAFLKFSLRAHVDHKKSVSMASCKNTDGVDLKTLQEIQINLTESSPTRRLDEIQNQNHDDVFLSQLSNTAGPNSLLTVSKNAKPPAEMKQSVMRYKKVEEKDSCYTLTAEEKTNQSQMP